MQMNQELLDLIANKNEKTLGAWLDQRKKQRSTKTFDASWIIVEDDNEKTKFAFSPDYSEYLFRNHPKEYFNFYKSMMTRYSAERNLSIVFDQKMSLTQLIAFSKENSTWWGFKRILSSMFETNSNELSELQFPEEELSPILTFILHNLALTGQTMNRGFAVKRLFLLNSLFKSASAVKAMKNEAVFKPTLQTLFNLDWASELYQNGAQAAEKMHSVLAGLEVEVVVDIEIDLFKSMQLCEEAIDYVYAELTKSMLEPHGTAPQDFWAKLNASSGKVTILSRFYAAYTEQSTPRIESLMTWVKSLTAYSSYRRYTAHLTSEVFTHVISQQTSAEDIQRLLDIDILTDKHLYRYTAGQTLFKEFLRKNSTIRVSAVKSHFSRVVESFEKLLGFEMDAKYHYPALSVQTLGLRNFSALLVTYGSQNAGDFSDTSLYHIILKKAEGFTQTAATPLRIGFFFMLLRSCLMGEFESLEKTYEEAQLGVKGWFDLSKILPNEYKWKLRFARHYNWDISYKKFITYDAECSAYDTAFVSKDPFDRKGGFPFATYIKIMEYVQDVPAYGGETSKLLTYYDPECTPPVPWVSIAKPAAEFAHLYGNDIESFKAYINEQGDAPTMRYMALHNASNFNFGALDAEKMRHYRPILMKNPQLLKYAEQLSKLEIVQNESVDDLIARLAVTKYKDVPKGYGKHILHASQHNWSQSRVDEFINIVEKQKCDKTDIPDYRFENDRVFVEFLDKQDPSALYIGELSGCCQHLGSAGRGAALQSFTEPWTRVLLVKSKGSGKLLAQAFIWLTADRKTIYLDSIESVIRTNDAIVGESVIPAIKDWAAAFTAQTNIQVGIGYTSYGLTSVVLDWFIKNQKIPYTPVKAPVEKLLYCDIRGQVLVIS